MKQYLKGLYMSCSMFCAIPLKPFWEESCVRYVLVCFPIVGGLIGGLWLGAAKILLYLKVPLILTTAIVSMFPFFVTGFLHLDGYMDTNDAILSRRTHEEKLRILKDPHTGAFAVIMIAVLFVMQFASVYVVLEKQIYLSSFLVIPIISRCCSAISIYQLRALSQSGYVTMYQKNVTVGNKIFVISILTVVVILSYYHRGIYGLAAISSAILGYMGAIWYSYRELDGISGDLAGYALVLSELTALFIIALL